MKQKFSLLLLFLVTLCTAVWADEEKPNVATIAVSGGETKTYTDIQSAIDALQTGDFKSSTVTFTLLSDQEIAKWTVQSTQDVTFVGGDYTLHVTSPIQCDGKLTVTGGTLKMDGYTSSDDDCGIRLSKATSNLTVNGGTIDSRLGGFDAICVDNADAHCTITGGNIYADANKYGACAVFVSKASTNSNVQISGGKFGACFNHAGSSAAIFGVGKGTTSEILAPGCCVGYDTEEEITDGWEYAEANDFFLWSSTHYASVISPVASTVVGTTKKIYKNFDNAWAAVNVASTTAKLYILQSCTAKNQMNPTSSTDITLIGGDNILSYDATGTYASDSWKGMFYLGNATAKLTFASGNYIAYKGDCIDKMSACALIIEGGEFTTKAANHHDIYCSGNDNNIYIKGGIFHFSQGSSYYYGGFQGSSLKNDIPEGYVLYTYDEATGAKTKVLYADRPTTNQYHTAFAVGVCDHSVTGTTCTYCNASIQGVASIGETTYNSLASAFAAATAGQTVKMNYGYAFIDNDYITVDKNVTLDLNGKTITGNRTKEGLLSGLFHVTAGNTLTVSDTSTGGTITNSGSGVAVSLASDATQGGGVNVISTAINVAANAGSQPRGNVNVLTVNSGIVTIPAAANLTVNDLAFNEGSLMVYGGTYNQTTEPASTAKMSITAGTFGFDPTLRTVATSSITNSGSLWTVNADAIVAHVTVGSTTTRYATMSAALDAANNAADAATITMVANETETTAATSTDDVYTIGTSSNTGKTITFEGGDYTWTILKELIIWGTLKFNSGTLRNAGTTNENMAISLRGTLELNGGTIDSGIYSGIDVTAAGASLTVTGGEIKSSSSGAIFVQSYISSYKFKLSGGTYTPASGKSAISIASWSGSTDHVRDLLVKGYDFYTVSGNTVVNANSTSLPDVGVSLYVKPLESFTVNNITYTVSSDVTAATYTVDVAGFETTPTVDTSVDLSASKVTDPNNSNNTYTVTGILSYAFDSQSHLTSITFPETLTSIGVKSFQDTGLTSVTIPENVTNIGKEAFQSYYQKSTLTTINYNAKNVTTVYGGGSSYPFWTGASGYNVLTTLNIGANVVSIPDYMFYNKGNTSLVVTSDAADAPSIGTHTFGGRDDDCKANIHATLKTPNATTNAQVLAYQQKWGFTKYDNGVTSLALTDANSTFVYGTYVPGNITYTRSGLTSGKYGSFAVPFDYDITTDCGIAAAYQPIGISLLDENNTLSVYFDEVTTVKAGYPVLAKLNASEVVLTNKAETTITSSTAGVETANTVYKKTGDGALVAKNTVNTVKFGGTFDNKTDTDIPGLYTFKANGSFGTNTYTGTFRAYISWTNSNGAKGMIINAIFGEDATTGISMIMSEDGTFSPVSGKIYDLNGRCVGTDVNALPRGMYIINGKKVMK